MPRCIQLTLRLWLPCEGDSLIVATPIAKLKARTPNFTRPCCRWVPTASTYQAAQSFLRPSTQYFSSTWLCWDLLLQCVIKPLLRNALPIGHIWNKEPLEFRNAALKPGN
ncbi:uncharacterized protein BDR25DRAFT_362501 [Lindgomyces ingoldianus]|uniref:Uncharacterized protein n=1 Tax=Lindgomyces ingoldianus TaxID=673940 RepID=A0ACB6QB21_9PLEO|nr:uncharacterized protein BDR25DRAFT_362501 [Lindgomyces ingoldianus]KAF2463690.1 hypothetical protein BDR25DRAFT_362501 [Lindgomyces ingoldianus]